MSRLQVLGLALLLAALPVIFAACGKDAAPTPDNGPASFAGLPSPSELARRAPARGTSGVHLGQTRTLLSAGADYVSFSGFSNNATTSGNDVILTGTTNSLNYCFFIASAVQIGPDDTLTEVKLNCTWPGPPPIAPEGLYLGIPDNTNDHWIWFNAADASGAPLDLSSYNLHGLDPSSFLGSWIALVNYGSSDVTVNSIGLRFTTPGSTIGDEWLYYSKAGSIIALASGIGRVQTDGTQETIHDGSLTDVRVFPYVVNDQGTWKLKYAHSSIPNPAEIWEADLDGTNESTIVTDAVESYYPLSQRDGNDYGLYINASSTEGGELFGFGNGNSGRLSRAGDFIQTACWDLRFFGGLSTPEFAAIAALQYDSVNDYYELVTFQGASPFPIDATPTQLISPLIPPEDQRDPDMVELAKLQGDAVFYVYFSARNRDDASYNIYRVRLDGSYPVERVVVDSTNDERYPAVSPDGRWLAYQRMPTPSALGDVGEIVLTDLLNPGPSGQVLASDSIAHLSWYDPAP